MAPTSETREHKRARRLRIGVRLVLYPLAFGLAALAWHYQHSASAQYDAAGSVQWQGLTSQGEPIQATANGVVLSFLHTHLLERCTNGWTFDQESRQGYFIQFGETVRREQTYPARSNSNDRTVVNISLDGRMGTHPTGAFRAETKVTTTYGVVRCKSGPVTFTLTR
jgi:hypothetical protein